jgi:peptidoglycan/LPS O-acetylase OafA/YrhL
MALVFVIPLAVASWWLIEKHALRLKGLKLPSSKNRTPKIDVVL